jgi:valyl-tRNA synthetase
VTDSTATDRAQLPPQYNPGEVEGPRYALWEKAGYFTADPERDAPTFSIVIPPPNVTGVLHIGHALDHTIIDTIVRRRRMQGYTALWLPGMDHAGIATQNVVERELAKEGLSRHDLGDTAVAVHPDDERYRHLVGKTVELPLTGRRIPIIADEHVDPAFGTGAVKVTPAHDPNDFEIGRRHDLPSLTILDERGVVTAHGPFQGLDRFEARPAVIDALREQGRIVREVRPYLHAVGHCQRCGTTVEPRLSLQWFVKVAPLAQAAGDAVRDGRVTLHPTEMNTRYFAWVDDMHDWCISRQLWWGHRIPVWYGPGGEVRCVGPDEEPPAGDGWHQDSDVLDTWFSSALWPFSTLGWPDDTVDLHAFYPTSVLVTGYDILFFWVVRMMMFGLYAMRDRAPADRVPFHDVALHGLVRDATGKKMSKSRGNAVDPLDWIDRFGADATRFTLARGANPGSDVPVSDEWAAGSRNFVNKLWNAARFALGHGARVPRQRPDPAALSVPDRWILSRLSSVIAEVDRDLDRYELAKACDTLYHFAWDEVCDWYLELAKIPLNRAVDQPDDQDAQAAAEATRDVLGLVLDNLLKLLHPLMPFVTDELWTALTGEESVMVAPWPRLTFDDAVAEAELEAVMRLVTEVRRFRSDQGLRPSQRVTARLRGLDGSPVAGHEEAVRFLLRLTPPADGFTPTAAIEAEGVTVELDTAGTIDVAAERRRMEKDLAAARKEAGQARAKLDNPSFTAKAPAAVIDKTRQRLETAETDITRLTERLAALGG